MQGECWIHWTGGKCPLPPGTRVEVRRRYAPSSSGLAASFHWSHDLYNAYGAEDIVAYRPFENAE